MTSMKSQRRVAPPWTEKGQSKPQSHPVLHIKLHTEPQPELHPTEPVMFLGYPPNIPSTSPGQAYYSKQQFPWMNINNGMELGESSYRTTISAPEVISFKSPDEMDYDQDNDDSDDDDDNSV